jgi:hypothetical protein
LGKIGEILIQEVLIKVGSNLIKRIGGKKTLPSILFLFLSISLFAQFPNTGNKQRLGFQTTADGLVWRGSLSDTASIQPVSNQNAWVILDTVNLKIYSFDFTSNVWNQLPSGTTIDTTSLSNRINLKLNLTGGTLTGALNGTTGNFSTSLGVGTSTASPVLYAGGSGNQEIHFYSDPASEGTETILRLTNKNPGFYTYGAYFKSIFQRGLNEYHAALGAGLTEFLYLENTAGGAKNLGIFNSNPNYNLDLTGTFNATGNSLIGGTLGVTGATTLGSTLAVTGATTLTGAITVNNATVLNEGSGDFDTRVESDGNANMVFVDASTDRVGIGTDTPSSTLSVNGSVNATDLSLTNPLPITSGGTGAESASVARTTLGVGYTFIASTAGSSVLSNSNRVSLVNTGGGSTTSIDLTTPTLGRMYMIKNLASGTVVSDASNVIPFAGGSAGTEILSAGNSTPQWCILVADGTNWHIMQRN